MKANIHPDYNEVLFFDVSVNEGFVTRSTIKPKDKMKWEDGKEYPVVRLEVSSFSHPFFTGERKVVDSLGRIAKFKQKYEKA